MKLTRASSYALSAVVSMADQKDGALVTSQVTAKAEHIPGLFLMKVLRPLVMRGILRSVKGPHGGYRLARPAKDITLLEIVEAVDGPIRGEAPLSNDGGKSTLDKHLTVICDQAAAATRAAFGKVAVSDLARQSGKRG